MTKKKVSTTNAIKKNRYTWGINPATRVVEDKKKYSRKRDKKKIKGNFDAKNFM
ncbi:MAG: hypothetical protein K9L17_13405 [Clostridiales bacterium]|nr:hypothetical protein [Clostridiales bacterium]MCF8023672.1 hypothetical protein [Clostridiales bacterium]